MFGTHRVVGAQPAVVESAPKVDVETPARLDKPAQRPFGVR